MANKFFAIISRMKLINRWGLMRNTKTENISEHSLDVAYIAHLLALLRNKRYGGNVNPERVALLAMYHDTPEILTGDLPTPIKYYNNDIKDVYDEIENQAVEKLISYLPDDLQEDYRPLLSHTEDEKELWQLVKAADKISALIKCIEERQMGNKDFLDAEKATLKLIKGLKIKEANDFLEEFIPAYDLTLDKQA